MYSSFFYLLQPWLLKLGRPIFIKLILFAIFKVTETMDNLFYRNNGQLVLGLIANTQIHFSIVTFKNYLKFL